MIIHYINLDEAVSRREALETNFATTCPPHLPWMLSRFSAISYQDDKVKKLEGLPTDREKACLLSHYEVLMQACHSDSYSWIVEDDVSFSKKSFEAVSTYLDLYKEFDWDILFTEITVRSAPYMLELFAHKQTLQNGEIKTLDLEKMLFASAGSYIINPKRRDKIMAVLLTHDLKNHRWDLFLSQCVSERKLKALVTIPFVTNLSDHSVHSQIVSNQTTTTDLLLYAFRKLMEISGDVGEAEKFLNMIKSSYFDDTSNCFGRIISGMVSENFIRK